MSDRSWAIVASNWLVGTGLGWMGGVGDRIEMVGGTGSGDGGGVRSVPGSSQWSAGKSEAEANGGGAGAGVMVSLPGSSQWSAGKSSADANGGWAEAGVISSAMSTSSSGTGLGNGSIKKSQSSDASQNK